MEPVQTPTAPAPAGAGAGVNGGRRRRERLDRRLAAARSRGGGLLAPLALSWALGIALVVELVRTGGFWQVTADTRVLDVLVRTGVVRLTDTMLGLIGTAPDVRYYVQANDYVDFIVVAAGVGLLLAGWWLRALQFHGLARFCGIEGGFGAHARAYFYGHGVNRMFPFGIGDLATAAALEGQGAAPERAAQSVYLSRLFVVAEAVFFALCGMAAVGYTSWLGMLVLPLGILAASYSLVRPVRGDQEGPLDVRGRLRLGLGALRALDAQRALLIRSAVLSLLAFGCLVLAAYLIAQAFSTTYVDLTTTLGVVALACVGGQLARLVIVTPGGIGQWEWGFMLPLWASGMGISEAVSLTLLVTAARYLSGGLVWLAMHLSRGVETNFSDVLERTRRPVSAPAPEPHRETADARVRSTPGARTMPAVSPPLPAPAGVMWPRLLGLVGLAIGLYALDRLARLLAQYWLLKSLGFSSVFWTNFRTGAILFAVFGALYVAAVAGPAFANGLSRLARRRALQLGLVFAAVGGYYQALNYNQYLLFFYGKHWGKSDPVFHHDVSLYVFKLPAVVHTVWVLNEIAIVGLVSSLVCAWMRPAAEPVNGQVSRPSRIAARLITPYSLASLGLLGLTGAAAEYLKMYGLLLKDNTTHSLYNGAQYVDGTGIWSTRHAIVIEAAALLVGTGMIIWRLSRLRRAVSAPEAVADRRRLRMRWVVAALIPGLVLDFGFKAMVGLRIQTQVTPNEPVVQLPYIKRHIDWTNDGFDLNKITTTTMTPKSGSDPATPLRTLLAHPTLANAPIWPGFVSWQERLLDPQHADRPFLQGTPADGHVDTMVYGPTLSTYHQQQKLRPYYDFLSMGTTRYSVSPTPGAPAQERIFASSLRELPQLTRDEWSGAWAQRNAFFTHGYGLVANEAQKVTANGEPVYASAGIPAQATYPQLSVRQPAVYYGEGESRMAFTDLKSFSEHDYATAEGRAGTNYPSNVNGGVKIDSPLKRLVFGYMSGQPLEVIFSKLVGSESRVHYVRQPIERLKAVAPFLYDDTRPFAVANGNTISWMVNGMTVSNRFPYSQITEIGDKSDRRTPFVRPTRWINYIRDSVKGTIDAYSGQVHLYKWANEPVVNTYAAIYPKLFQPKAAMPPPLVAQVQYPTQMAHIQMDDVWIFTHVKDPLTYFAQEDHFDDADQVFGPMVAEGKKITFSMEPYYWMAKPGEPGLPPASTPTQFAMSMIFTPENANNLRAIGTVYMDGKDYGRMSYIQVPKGSFFMSPQQADAAIDQDPYVAQQLGFFNRKGVQLIRGHMLPLLVAGELIYVEPLFIKSLQNPLPRLKRVLVVYRGHAVMGQDLPTALRQALNPNPQFPIRPGPELGGEPPFSISGGKVHQMNSVYAHDDRAANAHP